MSKELTPVLVLLGIIVALILLEAAAEAVVHSLAARPRPRAALSGRGVLLFVVIWNAPVGYAVYLLLKGGSELPAHHLVALLCGSSLILFLIALLMLRSVRLQTLILRSGENTGSMRHRLVVVTGLVFFFTAVVFVAALLLA